MAMKSASVAQASKARYRDPESGAIWSGHGRAPDWIASAKNRDKFIIDGSEAGVSTAARTSPKTVGNYVRGPQPALYCDPKSGATWSGRGKAPGWLATAKNRDRFLIDGNVTTATAVDKSSAKAVGNYPRGPQPAKYRDPKSGAEWSGRGKSPAWLAGAKDRTKFLIDGAAASATETKGTPANKTAVKKTTAKKTTAKKAVVTKAASKRASGTATTKKPATKSVSAPTKKASVKKVASKRPTAKKAAATTTNSAANDVSTSVDAGELQSGTSAA